VFPLASLLVAVRSSFYYSGQNELARDWLVLAFSRQRRVCRKEFVARTHLSIDMTTQLLEEFAVRALCWHRVILRFVPDS
jgi:hypothetical protein